MTATRKFTLHKRGDLVEVLFKASDRFRQMGTFSPLGRDRVVGVDTESLTRGGTESAGYRDGKLDTVLVPLYFSTGEQMIEVRRDGIDALELTLEAIHERYSLPEERPSRTAQRQRDPDGRLHGRREVVDPVLLAFFNLPYDVGRLCAKNPQLLRALVSGAETYEVRVGRYDVEVARMVLGAGSSLEWFVRRESRISRLLGIDLHGYWKSSLAAAAKAVGVSDKIEIDKDWYTRPFEEFEPEEWEEFKRYAAGDVRSTAELYHATVDLLRTVDARVVKRTGVVPPSAPGAAARIAFAKAFDLHPKRSWRRYPAWADQLGCDAYRGARAFCARPGVHRKLVVRDIKSAYPYVMTQLPDPVTVRCERLGRTDRGGFERLIPGLVGRFGVLVVDGEGLDPVYPALRRHDTARSRLQGVYGRFRGLAATVPEVMVGIADGSLRVDALRDGVVMHGENDTSFLRNAMLDFFAVKDNPDNAAALRGMGKLLANSTYGKLIEVQCNQFWVDSDVMCPPFRDLEPVAERLARLYAETEPERFDDEAADLIDRWHSFHLVACDDLGCRGCGPEPVESGPAIPLRQRMSRFKRYECGQYFMPLYAAQVTGLTSASLGLMARRTEAMQGDTDSVHTAAEGVEYRLRSFYDAMHDAGYGWPTSGLGSWSVETPTPSEESLCARIKLYSHKFADGTFLQCYACGAKAGTPCGCRDRPYKQAKHGFSKYPDGNAALHEAIRGILEGRVATYESRPSPRKIREALVHGLPVGEFVSREISVVAGVDPNTEIRDGRCYWKPLEG